MSKLRTAEWWIAALKRAAVSALVPFAAGFGVQNIFDIDIKLAASMALGGFVVSILKSLYRLPEADGYVLSRWEALAERVVATFAGALLGAVAVDVFDVFAFDWLAALNVAALVALESLIRNAVGTPPETVELVTIDGGPSVRAQI